MLYSSYRPTEIRLVPSAVNQNYGLRYESKRDNASSSTLDITSLIFLHADYVILAVFAHLGLKNPLQRGNRFWFALASLRHS